MLEIPGRGVADARLELLHPRLTGGPKEVHGDEMKKITNFELAVCHVEPSMEIRKMCVVQVHIQVLHS